MPEEKIWKEGANVESYQIAREKEREKRKVGEIHLRLQFMSKEN